MSMSETVAVALPRAIAERFEDFLAGGRTGQVRLNNPSRAAGQRRIQ